MQFIYKKYLYTEYIIQSGVKYPGILHIIPTICEYLDIFREMGGGSKLNALNVIECIGIMRISFTHCPIAIMKFNHIQWDQLTFVQIPGYFRELVGVG